jgi:hypothetical protein
MRTLLLLLPLRLRPPRAPASPQLPQPPLPVLVPVASLPVALVLAAGTA